MIKGNIKKNKKLKTYNNKRIKILIIINMQ